MNLKALSTEMALDATLSRLCDDPTLLLEILDLFLVEFDRDLPVLQAHLASRDHAWLAIKGHYLKGIAENLGLTNMLPHIRQLEQAAKQADHATCETAVAAICEAWQRLYTIRQAL